MKPSHRLHGLIGVLLGMVLFCTAETQSPQSQDILVIDLSKKSAVNPYQELYEKLLYPTVRIKAGFATGSGVIFNHRDTENAETIYILTAAHVVSDYSNVIVELFYPENIEIEATVIITDTIKDLALLRALCASAVKAVIAPKDYKPYIFAPVWAVGCSLGLPPRPSFGHLCALCDLCGENGNWEISAPILPGNSGGPVFDARTHEVIGIAIWVHTYNNQIVTTMAGIVPIQSIHEFLSKYTDLTDSSD